MSCFRDNQPSHFCFTSIYIQSIRQSSFHETFCLNLHITSISVFWPFYFWLFVCSQFLQLVILPSLLSLNINYSRTDFESCGCVDIGVGRMSVHKHERCLWSDRQVLKSHNSSGLNSYSTLSYLSSTCGEWSWPNQVFCLLIITCWNKKMELEKNWIKFRFLNVSVWISFLPDIVNVLDSIFTLMKMLYYRMEEKGNIPL